MKESRLAVRDSGGCGRNTGIPSSPVSSVPWRQGTVCGGGLWGLASRSIAQLGVYGAIVNTAWQLQDSIMERLPDSPGNEGNEGKL
jgi:hypothetical protein